MNDILLPLNGLLCLAVAYLYGSNISYESTPLVRMFVVMQTVTASVLGIVNLAAGVGFTTTTEWIWVLRPTFTFFLVALASLAFITRDSRRGGTSE